MTSKCQKVLHSLGQPYPRTCEQCGLGPCKEGYNDGATPDVLARVDNYDAFFKEHPESAEAFARWQAGRVGRWLGEAM